MESARFWLDRRPRPLHRLWSWALEKSRLVI
jgi:hypothetical protein